METPCGVAWGGLWLSPSCYLRAEQGYWQNHYSLTATLRAHEHPWRSVAFLRRLPDRSLLAVPRDCEVGRQGYHLVLCEATGCQHFPFISGDHDAQLGHPCD